jgi:hypothetical protein
MGSTQQPKRMYMTKTTKIGHDSDHDSDQDSDQDSNQGSDFGHDSTQESDQDSDQDSYSWDLIIEFSDQAGLSIEYLDASDKRDALDYAQANLHRYCQELLYFELEVPNSPLTGSVLWTMLLEYCDHLGLDPDDLDHIQFRSAVKFAQDSLDHILGFPLSFNSDQDSDQDSPDQDSNQGSGSDSDQDSNQDSDQDSNQDSDQDSGQDSDQESDQDSDQDSELDHD